MTSPKRVGLTPPQEQDVEVEIDGRIFAARSMTRTAQKKVQDAEQALDQSETTDDAALKMIGVLDALVEPTGGQRKTLSEVLTPMWEGDEITVSQLSKLLEDIAEAAVDRPT